MLMTTILFLHSSVVLLSVVIYIYCCFCLPFSTWFVLIYHTLPRIIWITETVNINIYIFHLNWKKSCSFPNIIWVQYIEIFFRISFPNEQHERSNIRFSNKLKNVDQWTGQRISGYWCLTFALSWCRSLMGLPNLKSLRWDHDRNKFT